MRDELQAREQLTTEKGAGAQAEASVTLANGRFNLRVVYRARPGADAMPFTELWKIIDETSLIDLMKLPVATHLSKEQLRALTAAKDAASALPSGDLLLPVVDVARISGCADVTVADAKHKMPGSVTRYYRCADRASLLMIVTQPGAFDFDKHTAQNDAKSNMQLIPGLGTGAYSTNRDWTFHKSKQNHLSIELNHASARVSLQMITPEREKALINSRDQLIELARIVDANLTRLKK